MSWIEIAAVVFGLLSVGLTIRQNIWCWPTGLVMVGLYAWIFFHARLYSDAGLQLVYVVLCTYGWVHWARGGDRESKLPVTTMTATRRSAWVAVGVGSAGVLGYVMDTRTGAALPYADALTTTLSLVAQYLMTRKRLECWVFWIVVDVVAVGVYTTKGLHLTAGLYAVFLVLATLGLIAWHKDMRARAGSSLGSSCPPTAGTSS